MENNLYHNWFFEENLAETYFMLTDKYRYINRKLHHQFGMKYLEHLQKMEQFFFALQQHIPYMENESNLEYQRILSSNYMLLADKYKFINPQMHIHYYAKFLRHVQLLEGLFLKSVENKPEYDNYKSDDPWQMWQYHGKRASTFMKLAMKYEYIDVNIHAFYEKRYLSQLQIMEENFLKLEM